MSATWQDKTQAGVEPVWTAWAVQDGQGDLQCCVAAELHAPPCYRFPQHVQRDRQTDRRRETWRNPPRPTSSVLSQGDISPLTLWVNRRVWWQDHVPLHSHVLDASIKSPWQSQGWRQDIQYVRAEITGPVITGNKASPSRLTIWKTINGKSEQRMLRVGLSVAAHNRSMIKGEFQRQKSLRQVAI